MGVVTIALPFLFVNALSHVYAFGVEGLASALGLGIVALGAAASTVFLAGSVV